VLRAAPTTELDVLTLHAILRLRSEVFVVEQACAYLDPDGRDAEPDCVQVWVTDDDGAVIATARVLLDADGRHRIGRVCTTPSARGRGIGALMMRAALERCGDGAVVIDAQSQLADWYAKLGFVATGHEFVEDGIHHSEMLRP